MFLKIFFQKTKNMDIEEEEPTLPSNYNERIAIDTGIKLTAYPSEYYLLLHLIHKYRYALLTPAREADDDCAALNILFEHFDSHGYWLNHEAGPFEPINRQSSVQSLKYAFAVTRQLRGQTALTVSHFALQVLSTCYSDGTVPVEFIERSHRFDIDPKMVSTNGFLSGSAKQKQIGLMGARRKILEAYEAKLDIEDIARYISAILTQYFEEQQVITQHLKPAYGTQAIGLDVVRSKANELRQKSLQLAQIHAKCVGLERRGVEDKLTDAEFADIMIPLTNPYICVVPSIMSVESMWQREELLRRCVRDFNYYYEHAYLELNKLLLL
jgi:hypothetical protein